MLRLWAQWEYSYQKAAAAAAAIATGVAVAYCSTTLSTDRYILFKVFLCICLINAHIIQIIWTETERTVYYSPYIIICVAIFYQLHGKYTREKNHQNIKKKILNDLTNKWHCCGKWID